MTLANRQIAFLLFVAALPSAGQSLPAHPSNSYEPITGQQRIRWYVRSTVGPLSLASGVFSAGLGTARNSPEEYGPHWEGFGKRYGIRLSRVATGNLMEAGLGSLWGEDPRYFRSTDRSFKGRISNIFAMTFEGRRPDGHLAPAYARFIAIPGSNFLSNTWRVDSDAGPGDAARRTALGFAGKIGGNAFREFWPDIKRHVFHRGHRTD